MFDKRGHTSLNKPLIIRCMRYNKRIVLIIFSDKCIHLKTRIYGTYNVVIDFFFIELETYKNIINSKNCEINELKSELQKKRNELLVSTITSEQGEFNIQSEFKVPETSE